MPEFGQVRSFLEQRFEQFAREVADPAQLRREFDNLQKYWQQEDDQALMLEETWRVMHKYPPVWEALRAEGLLEEEGSPQEGAPAPSISQAQDTSPPQPAGSEETPAGPIGMQSGGKAMGEETVTASTRDRLATWDKGTAIGKEAITGCMGILIILATLVVALVAIFVANQTDTWTRAKDVLVILNGLVGVVLGYYFGRMPGEARADKAEGEAQSARSELDRTKAEVRSILESGSAPLERGAPVEGLAVQLRPEQRERLRKLLEP